MTKPTAALVRRTEPAQPIAMRDFEDAATASIEQLIAKIASGKISFRAAERLRRTTSTLGGIVGDIERVATHGQHIARESAKLARDIEQFATEIDGFQLERAENAITRAEAKVRAAGAVEAASEELRVRTLTATVRAEELQAQLDARRAERIRDRASAERERSAVQSRAAKTRATREARAAAALQTEQDLALRILRDVQIGAVPADAAHPYHAYAACVYLAAQVDDGLTTEAAAERTMDALLRLMLGVEVAPDAIARYHEAYLELKARAVAAARQKDTAELFAAADAFTGGVQ